jgi:hypothetical protein
MSWTWGDSASQVTAHEHARTPQRGAACGVALSRATPSSAFHKCLPRPRHSGDDVVMDCGGPTSIASLERVFILPPALYRPFERFDKRMHVPTRVSCYEMASLSPMHCDDPGPDRVRSARAGACQSPPLAPQKSSRRHRSLVAASLSRLTTVQRPQPTCTWPALAPHCKRYNAMLHCCCL